MQFQKILAFKECLLSASCHAKLMFATEKIMKWSVCDPRAYGPEYALCNAYMREDETVPRWINPQLPGSEPAHCISIEFTPYEDGSLHMLCERITIPYYGFYLEMTDLVDFEGNILTGYIAVPKQTE